MEIVVDACAIIAVIVKEPERDLVIRLTKNTSILSPDVVPYEVANALTKMMKKKVIEKERMLTAFDYYKKIPIKTMKVNMERALEIAWDFTIYAYDACYLEIAQRLDLPLLTFDDTMTRVGEKLGVRMVGGKNADC